MKVLLISTQIFPVPPRGYGGLEGVVEDLAVELMALGHEVSIVCPTGSDVPGAELIMPCDPNMFGNPEGQAYQGYKKAGEEGEEVDVPGYKERMESGEWDVVHDHSWGGYPYLSKRDTVKDLRICHTIHSQQPWRTSPPVKFPCVITASKSQAEFLAGVLGMHSEVAYHGINLDTYTFQAKKDDYLLYCARVIPVKGAIEFVALCRDLGIRGKLVGEDVYIDQADHRYARQVMDQCDGRLVEYIGRVPRGSEYMVELMQNARALISPLAPPYIEIFGLATVEALACGTPVISTDRGAAKEIIIEGETGFVVPGITDLKEAVLQLDQCSPEACRQRAERFSRSVMARRHEQLYAKLLDGEGW